MVRQWVSQTPGCPPNYLGIQKPTVGIVTYENSPIIANGTYIVLDFSTFNPLNPLMNGLKRISANNITNSQNDGHVYEFDLTPNVRNFGVYFYSFNEFDGQYGMYEVTMERIERSTNVPYPLQSPFTCYTDPIADGLIPLPVPRNLQDSFKSGATTPTLSFDRVRDFPSDSSEWYEIRIYDKDYTRRIYSAKIGTGWCGSSNGNPVPCSIVGSKPRVKYDDYRSVASQTYEDLVPGEEYIFRAELNKVLLPSGSTYCSPLCNLLQAINFITFKVPQ